MGLNLPRSGLVQQFIQPDAASRHRVNSGVRLSTKMLIDVEDAGLNTVLNACFVANVALTLLALVPWRVLGVTRLCRLFRWVSIPVLVLAFVYESYMPTGCNIRVDLLILLPLYVMALATSAVRWNLESRC